MQVNVTSLMALTHLFAPGMAERSRGGIINIASLAAFQPQFSSAVYAAGKSFVLLFSEALWLELAPRSVHVLAVCPGPVVTSFFERIGSKPPLQAISPERGGIRDLASLRQEAGRGELQRSDSPGSVVVPGDGA